jgi:hypothetical protein
VQHVKHEIGRDVFSKSKAVLAELPLSAEDDGHYDEERERIGELNTILQRWKRDAAKLRRLTRPPHFISRVLDARTFWPAARDLAGRVEKAAEMSLALHGERQRPAVLAAQPMHFGRRIVERLGSISPRLKSGTLVALWAIAIQIEPPVNSEASFDARRRKWAKLLPKEKRSEPSRRAK